MIAFVIVALLVVAAMAYVLWPLLGTRKRVPTETSPALAEAMGRKRAALGAIVDLESDHDMRKLSDPDFEALRRDYEAEALDALRALDALQGQPDDEIEREIAEVRARLECPACGAPRPAGAACPRCGTGSATETA